MRRRLVIEINASSLIPGTEISYKDLILVAEKSFWYRNLTCELYY
jgi:hypothetical protein